VDLAHSQSAITPTIIMETWLYSWSEEMSTHRKVVGGVLAAGVLVTVVVKVARGRRRASRREDYPRDTVILHQPDRAPYAPSLTPLGVKLETFLRMTKLPYRNVCSMEPSPKGKVPWIEYNGQIVSDSQFCIEFLKKECGLDLNSHLTPEERAIARAFQKMLEENTYWTGVLARWVYDTEKVVLKMMMPWFVYTWIGPRLLKKQAHAQGMGRHTEAEVMGIMKEDLRAVSDFLGQKKFLMGNAKPSEVDCSVFAFLSQMKWQNPRRVMELITLTYPNLSEYCDRLRDMYWPDWDDCTTRGGTQEAKN
jgi:hypothetical protein